MSKRTIKLQEQLEEKINAQEVIRKTLETEKRDFKEDERSQFDTLEEEIEELERKIKDSQALDKAEKRAASYVAPEQPRGAVSPEEKVSKRYSLLKAIRAKAEGKPLDGVELEMHQEAENEARNNGLSIEGLGVPSMLVDPNQRDLNANTPDSASALIDTDMRPLIPALTPTLSLQQMGATVMSGLVGNVNFPIGDALASAAWAGENDDAQETNPTVRTMDMSPKRLAAFTTISKQLLIQTSQGVENWVRNSLSNAVARKVEMAGLNGSGSGNEPLGILNESTVTTKAIGIDGGNLTRAILTSLMTAIETNNADIGNMGFIVTPEVRGFLQNLKVDEGSGLFVWPNNVPDSLLGYKAMTSNLLPKNSSKGSGTNLHSLIFGDFSNLIIGNWGGADIIVDPYTKAKKGQIEIVTNTFWDLGIIHGKGFSVIKDIQV